MQSVETGGSQAATPISVDIMPHLSARPPLELLSYPLNVYARLVELEAGQVDYLHYGLFDGPDTPIAQAQANSTRLLQQHLPPPCKLLEIGVGLGTTLQLLIQAGYDVTGITPDAAQINFIEQKFGSAASPHLRLTRFEDFLESPKNWDALLFQESAQYIHPIDIFEKAQNLLKTDGKIIILDEFSNLRTSPGEESLHLFEDFANLAKNSGFDLIFHEDVGSRARWTSEWLVKATQRHEELLNKEFNLPQNALDELNASNRTYGKRYAAGHFTYKMLVFQRKTSSKNIHLIRREISNGDAEYRLDQTDDWKARISSTLIGEKSIPCAWINSSPVSNQAKKLALQHLLENEIGWGQIYSQAYIHIPDDTTTELDLNLENFSITKLGKIYVTKYYPHNNKFKLSIHTSERIPEKSDERNTSSKHNHALIKASKKNQNIEKYIAKNKYTNKTIGQFEWVRSELKMLDLIKISGSLKDWPKITKQILIAAGKLEKEICLQITATSNFFDAMGLSSHSASTLQTRCIGQLFHIRWTTDDAASDQANSRGWIGPVPD